MLILYLYHLLITVALRHPYQSSKLAYSVVNMHHIVAHLELSDFLQSQCHLSSPRFVRSEVILVETIEYLVIGKETNLQVVVGESLVEGEATEAF